MFTVGRSEADGRGRTSPLWFQLLMREGCSPGVNYRMNRRGIGETGGRWRICPSRRTKTNDSFEVRFIFVQVRL
jgi:hypothetical protein